MLQFFLPRLLVYLVVTVISNLFYFNLFYLAKIFGCANKLCLIIVGTIVLYR